jgi:choline dehydrogenase
MELPPPPSGSIIAGELSKTGADVPIVESGAADTGPTISNPSIWFYNIGGPLDWKLPIAPVPQLNNRKFNMALGHVGLATDFQIGHCRRPAPPPTTM